jgi:putative protease
VNEHPVKPEIMSPAGYFPQLHAAIEAGADAVYFGLRHFTARAKVGFSVSELTDVMRLLHQRGVRGYLTFNTLIFDHELSEAATTVAAIAAAGVDAVIVQDVGVARLIQQIAPELEIHGSTQMSITNAEGIELAKRFGVRRVVLARELSLDEIRAIRSETDCELEMFVHGALCVSYSGQCFSSEAWGGRSANRGQCAQACRLPYEMLVDGETRPLGEARYLLSPEDLYALRQMPDIVKLGVSALKIEGRYKDENYVALTTSAYRKAVDEAWAGVASTFSGEDELRLAQVYSRGFGPHFLRGTNHQSVVPGRSPRHRGVLVGRVAEVRSDSVVIVAEPATALSPVKPGDGLVFDAADWRSPEEPEEGGRVYEVAPLRSTQLILRFGNNAIDFSRVRAGDLVWRSDDPELEKTARPFTAATAPVHRQPLDVHVIARAGERLVIECSLQDKLGHKPVHARVESETTLAPSQTRPLTIELLREQLGRLGGTPYVLRDLQAVVKDDPFVPTSVLNDLRRRAVAELTSLQTRTEPVQINDSVTVLREAIKNAMQQAPGAPLEDQPPQLHMLVRTPEQLDAAIDVRPASITLDYLDLYGLRPAVDRVRSANITARVASPRILKPHEERVVHFLLQLECDIVVRSTGLLQALSEASSKATHSKPRLIGDFSLNAANVLSTRTFLDLGLHRLTPTHDLNAAQIADLARNIGPDRIEVIGYHHLPVFHTEHCVFCRFLSTGTSYENCGRPCEKHRVALRDQNGREHPVMADVGCRNTVFGAEAQEASKYVPLWLEAGIRHYRVEFAHETADQTRGVARVFADAVAGKTSPADLRRQLLHFSPQGITEGSLFIAENYLKLPIL